MRLPTFLVIGAAKGGTTSLYRFVRSPAASLRALFACLGVDPDVTSRDLTRWLDD